MIDIPAAFAATYAEARAKFLQAATERGAAVTSDRHPTVQGAEGEELAIDVAVLGDAHATALLVVLSGMHGIEGFCGSGCQVALLSDDDVVAEIDRSGVAVLLCHAVNPWGFSHRRRTNENNVDLNRNFRDFSQPQAPNAAYAELHAIVVPSTWPPTPENSATIAAYVARYGAARLQAAVSGGQCEFGDGLFYAGRAPEWSNMVLRAVLRSHGEGRRSIGWIDIHTGLGPWGHGEKIYSGPDDPSMIARARSWFGSDVTSFYDGTSTSAQLTGVSFLAALESCPLAEFTGIGLEFGTLPYDAVFHALRADQWLSNHPEEGAPMRDATERRLTDAFHDGSPTWQAMVYGQARVALVQALRALRSQPAAIGAGLKGSVSAM